MSAATVMMLQKSPVAAPPLTPIPKSVRFLRRVDFLDELLVQRQSRNAISQGPDGGFGSIARFEFPQDILNVFLYGFETDIQYAAYLTIAQPKRQMTQDLKLPFCKGIGG